MVWFSCLNIDVVDYLSSFLCKFSIDSSDYGCIPKNSFYVLDKVLFPMTVYNPYPLYDIGSLLGNILS